MRYVKILNFNLQENKDVYYPALKGLAIAPAVDSIRVYINETGLI